MSVEKVRSNMTGESDELDSGEEPFGSIQPMSRGPFGDISGGTLGGGFDALLEGADRDRGFLSKADREFLLETHEIDLSNPTQRNARTRVRNRILSTYFDSRYLQYLSERDRGLIFQNARQAGFDLHFRHGFKEFVRFTYLGLLENSYEIEITELLETAIQEAEEEYATAAGENVNVRVDIDVTHVSGDSVNQLEQRYTRRDLLDRKELEVLVNSDHTNDNDEIIDASDIDLVDAIYYDARQPKRKVNWADRGEYNWEDPDRVEPEEIVDWLRSLFVEYDIESYAELEQALDWLVHFDEELGQDLRKKLDRLPRVAPYFPAQMASTAKLPEEDMKLLHDILRNANNVDVKQALEDEARPPTAGKDWSPDGDDSLQRFIARVEVAREANAAFTSDVENGKKRWEEVLHIADFDEDKWSEYMREQRINKIKDRIEKEFESNNNLSTKEVINLDAFEEKKDKIRDCLDVGNFVRVYGEDVFSHAVKDFVIERGGRGSHR